MVTYRRPQYLGEAVQGLLRQSWTDWELLVVDDSEDDATQLRLRQWHPDPRFRYFHRGRKLGYASALNFGLERAQGDYIAILDDDDYWIEPDKLALQAAYLDRHPDCCACSSAILKIDPEGRPLGRVEYPENDTEIRACLLVCNPIANCSVMFRKSLGRYDEQVRHTADWDLWLRAGRTGKFFNFSQPMCAYRVWPGSGTRTNASAHVADRYGIIRRYRRDYPGLGRAVTLTALLWLHARLPAGFQESAERRLSRLRRAVRRWVLPQPVR